MGRSGQTPAELAIRKRQVTFTDEAPGTGPQAVPVTPAYLLRLHHFPSAVPVTPANLLHLHHTSQLLLSGEYICSVLPPSTCL